MNIPLNELFFSLNISSCMSPKLFKKNSIKVIHLGTKLNVELPYAKSLRIRSGSPRISKSECLVQMWKNKNHKNSEYGHFWRSIKLYGVKLNFSNLPWMISS